MPKIAVFYTLKGRISRTDGLRTKSRTYSNSASKTLSHISETAKSMTCVDGRQSASVDSLGKRLLISATDQNAATSSTSGHLCEQYLQSDSGSDDDNDLHTD